VPGDIARVVPSTLNTAATARAGTRLRDPRVPNRARLPALKLRFATDTVPHARRAVVCRVKSLRSRTGGAKGELDPRGSACSLTNLDMTGGTLGDPSSTATVGLTYTGTGGNFEAPVGISSQPVLTQSGTAADTITNPAAYINNWSFELDGPLALSGTFYAENGASVAVSGAATLSSSAIKWEDWACSPSRAEVRSTSRAAPVRQSESRW
jgi:hypothetical protein